MPLIGKWRIALDGNFKDWPFKTGETEKWYAKELPDNESLFLLNQIYFKNADFRGSFQQVQFISTGNSFDIFRRNKKFTSANYCS